VYLLVYLRQNLYFCVEKKSFYIMNPIQKPISSAKQSANADKPVRVSLSIVSDKERQDARIPTYAYILP